MLGVRKSYAFNFQDHPSGGAFLRNNKREMKRRLTKRLDETYHYAFSHSLQEWNEYSNHPNHEEVGIIASEIAKEKSWPLIRFCYRPIYPGRTSTVANQKANSYLQLDYKELRFKLDLIDRFLPGEMDNLRGLGYPCPNPEAFEGDGLPAPPFIKWPT